MPNNTYKDHPAAPRSNHLLSIVGASSACEPSLRSLVRRQPSRRRQLCTGASACQQRRTLLGVPVALLSVRVPVLSCHPLAWRAPPKRAILLLLRQPDAVSHLPERELCLAAAEPARVLRVGRSDGLVRAPRGRSVADSSSSPPPAASSAASIIMEEGTVMSEKDRLAEARQVVKQQAFYMKRALDQVWRV